MTESTSRGRLTTRIIVVSAVGAAIAAFFALGLHDLLTLEALRAGRDALIATYRANPWAFALGFFALYVLIAALSVPGATAMTIAAGSIFGIPIGVLLVSVASTAGATLSFLLSRHLFRDAVQRRFGARLRTINEGMERDGALYLFTLRLVPAFPFFLVNLLMGLSTLPLRTFWWVSQLGMLAGTFAYVNAGAQLSRVDSASDVLSPAVLGSFALLAVFPWIARLAMRRLAAARAYRGWRRPKRFDRNLVVIGAGAAGLVSAYIAAAVRARVTLVESGAMGGDCLNTGCVPSKALIRSARLAHQMRHADRYGLVASEPRFEFRTLMRQVHDLIAAIAPHDSVERYTRLGVEVIQGHAKLVNPWTVEIGRADGGIQHLTTRGIVIAAGARPTVPHLPGIEESGYVTSDTIWERFARLDSVTRRMVVLGVGFGLVLPTMSLV
ncbi:MAG: VTT domain-containing protein, partial [Steroidobacteraceae bacterium]